MEIFDFIKAKHFFPVYAPAVKNWRHKMSKTDGHGGAIAFTEDDVKEIKRGVQRLKADVASDVYSDQMKAIIV